MAQKKSALGRGLDALISTGLVRTDGSSSISEVPIYQIYANPGQPRKDFDNEALVELSESIREIGIIQPVTLRKIKDGEYQIIAGERRFRAAQMAGLETITAYIRTADDENMMEMALIENIQREDLNAMEIALACQSLLEMYNLTQEQLSVKIGKKRATIANYLRLLKLPAEIQVALKNKIIDMGHARAILSLVDPKEQITFFHQIKDGNFSVRAVEERVKSINNSSESSKPRKQGLTEAYEPLSRQLSDFFNTPVRLSCSKIGKGNISIAFNNETELRRILQLLDSSKQIT